MQKISDVLAAIGKVCKGAAAKVLALVATMAMIGAVAGVSATAVAQDLTAGDDTSVQTDAGADAQAGDATVDGDAADEAVTSDETSADGTTAAGDASTDDGATEQGDQSVTTDGTATDEATANDTTAQQSGDSTPSDDETASRSDAVTSQATKTASDDSELLGAPEHHKRIKSNGDGTYTLYLDVKGAEYSGSETSRTPADVVLVMDTSGSMNYDADPNCRRNCKSRWDVAKAAATNLAQNLMKANEATADAPAATADDEIRISMVDFSRYVNSTTDWTNNAQDIIDELNGITPGGGTNWEAALSTANGLNTGRSNAKKYIVFVSDGAPTWRNSANGYSQDYNQRYELYGNGQSDPGNRNFNAAVSVANQRGSGVQLFAVSTGSEATERMNAFATSTGGSFFDGTNEEKLAAAFDSIVNTITTKANYRDVLISDKLSEYAEATWPNTITAYATDAEGNEASLQGATYKYNNDTKTLTLDFPSGTTLDKNVTYTVTLNIRPSDDAYKYYAANSSYPNTGDPDTDKDTATSSNQPGFFSNATDEAYVQYKTVTTVDGKETVSDSQKSPYQKPVIQVDIPTLTLIKGVNNANAGTYGADPEAWTLSALKDNNTYGIDSKVPDKEVESSDGLVRKSTETVALAPGTYVLSEGENAQYAKDGKPYQYYGGYSSGDWSCKDSEDKDISVSKSSVKLATGQHVTCTVINTAKPGSIAWQKVAANDMNNMLKDSEWKLTSTDVAGFAETTVIDDKDNDAAADQPGSLKVTGLKWGEYTLEETKAPAGYQPSNKTYTVTVLPAGDATADAEFTVDAVEGGKITNKLVAVSSLPLTGGTTGRDWLIYGGGMGLAALLAGAGYTIWRKRQLV